MPPYSFLRAASTFAGTGPNGGGFAMTFAGFTAGVGDVLHIGWAGGVGLVHGGAMVVNSLTMGSIGTLDSYVDGLIKENGGFYGTAQVFADIGASALTIAGGISAYRAIASLSMTIVRPTFGWIMGSNGMMMWGVTGTATNTITGAPIATAIAGIGSLVFMTGGGFEKMKGDNNQHENKKFEWVADKLKLNKDQRRQLHDEIMKQGFDIDEIERIARNMFNKN